jgi:hypothetical protein
MLLKTYDQGSSLFFLFISIIVFFGSLHLGVGSLRKPGIGFLAFGASGLLGILSLALFIQTSFKKKGANIKPFFSGTYWERVAFAIIIMLIYTMVMPVAGYLISTFLLMVFLFWIVGRERVWMVLILSFLTTVITYYVFSVWLRCNFPSGPFRL